MGTLLKKIGVAPQRCLRCRRRFYLYRPAILELLLRALAGSPARPRAAETTDVVWNRLAEADPREGGS